MSVRVIALDAPVVRIAGYSDDASARLASLLRNGQPDVSGALAVLALTDPVARTARGLLGSCEHVYYGPHADLVMLPFLHPYPARFNDARFGAWYAGDCIATAFAEKAYHLARWLSLSQVASSDLRAQVLEVRLARAVADCRRERVGVPAAIYNPDPAQYDAAQRFADRLRADGVAGIFYSSVRRARGACVAVLQLDCIVDPVVTAEVRMEWRSGALLGFAQV